MPLVSARHRPTLGEVSAGWPRWLRLALLGLAVLALGALVASRFAPENRGIEVVREAAPPFNFVRSADLAPVEPLDDQYLRFARIRPDGLFVQSFGVGPLRLPPYRGEVSGILPIAAEAVIGELARRHDEFELVREGKTRVNEVPGYSIFFIARDGERRLFGRTVLLAEPRPGARAGVQLDMLSTYAGGASSAGDVGVTGAIKRPFRSFRFGTEGP